MVVMHKGLLRKRILVLAGCASVAITTAAIGVASATVPAGAPNITGVTVTGYPSNPVISVTGTKLWESTQTRR